MKVGSEWKKMACKQQHIVALRLQYYFHWSFVSKKNIGFASHLLRYLLSTLITERTHLMKHCAKSAKANLKKIVIKAVCISN